MSLFQPDLYYRSVADIDLEELERRGVRFLLLDLDNTLVRRNTLEASPETRTWLERAQEMGLGLAVVSNNWHDRVKQAADVLGVPVFGKAIKPLPSGFRRALGPGRRARASAVIGDQIFTDVLGGRIIGATTVLVSPLAGGSDLPHTRLLRALERRIMRGRVPAERSRHDTVGGLR